MSIGSSDAKDPYSNSIKKEIKETNNKDNETAPNQVGSSGDKHPNSETVPIINSVKKESKETNNKNNVTEPNQVGSSEDKYPNSETGPTFNSINKEIKDTNNKNNVTEPNQIGSSDIKQLYGNLKENLADTPNHDCCNDIYDC